MAEVGQSLVDHATSLDFKLTGEDLDAVDARLLEQLNSDVHR